MCSAVEKVVWNVHESRLYGTDGKIVSSGAVAYGGSIVHKRCVGGVVGPVISISVIESVIGQQAGGNHGGVAATTATIDRGHDGYRDATAVGGIGHREGSGRTLG